MDKQRRILVVDDDPDILESIRLVLGANSYLVTTSESRDDGLRKARTEKPDLILLDVMMPEGTEGFEFVWELRADQDAALRKTPIILLTAIHGTTELRFYPNETDSTYGEGEYLQVQGFIDKPVEPRALIAQIEKTIRASQM